MKASRFDAIVKGLLAAAPALVFVGCYVAVRRWYPDADKADLIATLLAAGGYLRWRDREAKRS